MKSHHLLSLILIGSYLAGCNQSSVHPDLTPPSAPTGLRTSTGDNFIDLSWNRNAESDVAGYNVWVGESYNGRYELIGSPHDPYFRDDGAANGNTYYYAVSAVDFEGNESALSKDVAYDIPRPEGYNVVVYDYRTTPADAGYDFSTYAIMPFNDQGTDMYYEYYGGISYMDVGTDTDIQDMGPTASILDISLAPSQGWSPTHDVVLVPGHTYVVWTWDDHYAKFRVTTLSPSRAVFDWAYQLVKSNPMLKRAIVPGGQRQHVAAEHNRTPVVG